MFDDRWPRECRSNATSLRIAVNERNTTQRDATQGDATQDDATRRRRTSSGVMAIDDSVTQTVRVFILDFGELTLFANKIRVQLNLKLVSLLSIKTRCFWLFGPVTNIRLLHWSDTVICWQYWVCPKMYRQYWKSMTCAIDFQYCNIQYFQCSIFSSATWSTSGSDFSLRNDDPMTILGVSLEMCTDSNENLYATWTIDFQYFPSVFRNAAIELHRLIKEWNWSYSRVEN